MTKLGWYKKAIAYYVKGAEEFRKEPHQGRMLRLIWFKPIKEMLNYDIHIQLPT
jgi:hypothetical protein